jgi:hypothetical protein
MRPTFPVFAAMIVAGCASGVETRVSSSGADALLASSYMVDPSAGLSADARSAHSLASQKLAQMGFVQAEQAPLHLEVTFDQRDASLSLGDGAGPGSISGPKKRKPFQSCADREYRLGVTITRIADGVELFRGRAAEYHCKLSAEDALPALVEFALADLGNPRGSYVVKRHAQD